MPESLVIDFGTTNTVVAEWTDSGPATVRLEPLARTPESGMPPVIPSLLYVEKAGKPARVLVGQEVVNAGLDSKSDGRFWAAFKRGIAAEYREPPRQIDDMTVTYEQAGAWFLAKVLRKVRESGRPADSVLFTLPIGSFETYAKWLSTVAAGMDVSEMHLLDESTAAALGYEVNRSRVPVLVFDFGGGTLDISAVRTPDLSAKRPGLLVPLGRLFGGTREEKEEIAEGTAQVLGKASKDLGGEDLDLWIGDEVLRGYGKTRADVEALKTQFKNTAERVKVALSTATQTTFSFQYMVDFDWAGSVMYNRDFSRSDFEDLLDRHDFFQTIQKCLDSAMRQAELEGIRREDFEHVALTGGSSLIPCVQRALRQNFGDRVVSHKPFEAVAHGALRAVRGVRVEDFLYHSYGIEGWNSSVRDPRTGQRGAFQYDVIFEAGAHYPSPEAEERRYPCASRNQTEVELAVGEIDHGPQGAAEVIVEAGRLRLADKPAVHGKRAYHLVGADQVVHVSPRPLVVRLNPPGQPGPDRIACRFWVDGTRALRVTATDLLTRRTLVRDEKLADVT